MNTAPAQKMHKATTPITVKNRAGDTVIRDEGIMQDGDVYTRGMMFMDNRPPADANEATRHAYVRDKLGAAADGKCGTFLDAAFRALQPGYTPTTTAPSVHQFTDAQRTVAQRGVDLALADNSRRGLTDRQAAYDGMRKDISTAWAGDRRAPVERPAAKMSPFKPMATDSAQAGHLVADKASAHGEMVDYLNDAWKGGAR